MRSEAVATNDDHKKSIRGADKQAAQVVTAISDISDGCIGRLKVYASGKVVAVIGNIEFDVNEGHRGCFRQEVACISPEDAEVLFLGQVAKNLILSLSIFQTDRSHLPTQS